MRSWERSHQCVCLYINIFYPLRCPCQKYRHTSTRVIFYQKLFRNVIDIKRNDAPSNPSCFDFVCVKLIYVFWWIRSRALLYARERSIHWNFLCVCVRACVYCLCIIYSIFRPTYDKLLKFFSFGWWILPFLRVSTN